MDEEEAEMTLGKSWGLVCGGKEDKSEKEEGMEVGQSQDYYEEEERISMKRKRG